MPRTFVAISALLLAAFILVTGNGLQNTLLAVRANIEGFPLWLIGSLTSSYFVGFIAGCRITPHFVKSVGHIRSFTALASIASAAALAHALFVDSWAWLPLRVATGFCLAGLQMIIESWINERATNATRGQVLGGYRIIDLGASTLGQLMLTLADPASFALFAAISILISLSLVPVALTTAPAPQPIATARLDIAKLFRVSPLAAVASLAVGAANGSFWAMAAVWVQLIGYEVAIVAVFMSVAIVSGALAQWPLGLLSDRMDRRRVIVGCSLGAAGASVLLSLFSGLGAAALLALGAGFGFFAMPVLGLGMAHANDYAKEGEFVEVSGGLFLLYGAGSVLGPMIAPQVMDATTPSALFIFIAVFYAALAGFGVYRMTKRSAAAEAEKTDYVAVPRTTPAIFELDPRSASEEENEGPATAERPA